MAKQRLLFASGPAVLFLSVVCLFLCAHFRKRFNEDAAYYVKLGMTLSEVEAIMGGPPKDYGYGEIGGWDFDGSIANCCLPSTEKNPMVKTWTGQRRVTCVEFDDAQKSRGSALAESLGCQMTFGLQKYVDSAGYEPRPNHTTDAPKHTTIS
jgi:hypothetical protein